MHIMFAYWKYTQGNKTSLWSTDDMISFKLDRKRNAKLRCKRSHRRKCSTGEYDGTDTVTHVGKCLYSGHNNNNHSLNGRPVFQDNPDKPGPECQNSLDFAAPRDDQLLHFKNDVTCILLVAAFSTFLVSDVPVMENGRLPRSTAMELAANQFKTMSKSGTIQAFIKDIIV